MRTDMILDELEPGSIREASGLMDSIPSSMLSLPAKPGLWKEDGSHLREKLDYDPAARLETVLGCTVESRQLLRTDSGSRQRREGMNAEKSQCG